MSWACEVVLWGCGVKKGGKWYSRGNVKGGGLLVGVVVVVVVRDGDSVVGGCGMVSGGYVLVIVAVVVFSFSCSWSEVVDLEAERPLSLVTGLL